ncbi:MAG: hypothetical protein R3E09_13510 [Novosphingobium sp.]
MTKAGCPLDTPTYYFPSDDMATLDLATGVSTPAKAERARCNSKVGLLIEGAANEPVVAIRARAAVRDTDLQANCLRYLAETGFKGIANGLSWSQAREATYYWSRIIVENTAERIYWWDDQAALDGAPQVLSAAPDAAFPLSDPASPGGGKPSPWQVREWQAVAGDAVASGLGAHLTVVDEDGYPLPMRAMSLERTEEGFRLQMPKGVPWTLGGPACLTFAGYFTFVGTARSDDSICAIDVERSLPEHPSTKDAREVLQPSPDTLSNSMKRLEYEVERRGQSIPVVPESEPAPTRLAMLRQQRLASDAPITGLSEEQGNRSS